MIVHCQLIVDNSIQHVPIVVFHFNVMLIPPLPPKLICDVGTPLGEEPVGYQLILT